MPRERSRYNRSKPRKKPAYPKAGTGEDFPAGRPGTKTGETRRGGTVRARTRASQARSSRKERPFEVQPLPRAGRPRAGAIPNWQGGRPTGKRQWPFSTGVRGKPTKRNPWPL